jgi:hypothetical protein
MLVQLDRTEIVIRARSALELLDLSLLVLKKHAWQIALTSALLGLPLLVLDVMSVAWMLSEDTLMVAERLDNPLGAMRWRHSAHLVLLFVMQFPLVSLPTTVFLGSRIFYEPMPMRKLLRRLWPIAGRSVLVLGVLRLGLVGLVLELWVNRGLAFDWLIEFWLLFGLAVVGIIFRAGWPFAPEIIGLELCPLRATKAGEITYAGRSSSLHKLLMSDHVARFIGAACFSTLLFLSLISGQIFVWGASTGNWQWNFWFDYVSLPLTLWIVGLFMAVFRFLSYLDSRIRLEGWEIELRLKAEAARMDPPAKISSGSSDTPQETFPEEQVIA